MFALVPQGNRVGSEGLQSIAQALLGNTALKELVLCDNTIGAVSAGGGGADDVCLSVSVTVPSSTPLRVVAGPLGCSCAECGSRHEQASPVDPWRRSAVRACCAVQSKTISVQGRCQPCRRSIVLTWR